MINVPSTQQFLIWGPANLAQFFWLLALRPSNELFMLFKTNCTRDSLGIWLEHLETTI